MKEEKNFVIVENHDDGVDYEELKQDYLNPWMSVKHICRKWGISRKNYNKYRKDLVKDTGVKRKPSVYIGNGVKLDDYFKG